MPAFPVTYDQLSLQIKSLSVDINVDNLQKAWSVAEKAYKGKTHWTGVPYMEHVMGTLQNLLPFQPDEESIIACLLHHSLECKYWTVSELEEEFGPKIREIVSGVHLLSHVTLHEKRISIEDLKLMLVTVSKDIRTIVLLLCDKLYLLSPDSSLPKDKEKRLAKDVLELFAPVAARLGIYKLKHGLEAEAFSICYPEDAERISEQILNVEKKHGKFMGKIVNEVRAFFLNEGISVKLEARTKYPYSSFRKMREKGFTHILDLYDYYALRVIVEKETDCYQVLGLFHKIGLPVTHRFKDYIAFPKPNGYRSIHTTVVQLPGSSSEEPICVEVQVRTAQMHREAQYGVAAHWIYKDSGAIAKAATAAKVFDSLSNQSGLTETGELSDYIFVLTPMGNVIELPEGATPLDFAFQVHTDLGLSFRGARVNGSIIALDYQLENGDMVEILKHKTPRPSSQWFQLLKMSSSRSKLKQFLYAQKRPEYISKGREAVNIELRKHHLPPLDTSLSLLRDCDGKKLTIQEREDILMKIGQGAEKPASLLARLKGVPNFERKKDEKVGDSEEKPKTIKSSLVIEGDIVMPTRFAKCCAPDKGIKEVLMGVVNRSGEIVVHKKSCGMLRNSNPERRVRIWWE
ncbi:MAG: bifunctional (p)ppGpp synthetase/guanosine-3',5'-bis(diphosphate) 3'-pyrophosphohydrolase [Candidatus Peribacteraceae bacterium]|nr:bifunctional (p)ppGpp synthetase/guanosine-3',5'-bis(diphosphate) 3'-pyrophosphohydrolase [Candidatus Peribacteraceae bacterium]